MAARQGAGLVTPAAAAAPAKPKFETVQDSRVRSIQLRTLDPIQQVRLVMAVGTEGMNAINQHLMAKFRAMEEEQTKAALSAEQAAAKN